MDFETANEATVSKTEALREVAKHGCDATEFLAEVGDKATYRGSEVLNWLGY